MDLDLDVAGVMALFEALVGVPVQEDDARSFSADPGEGEKARGPSVDEISAITVHAL